MDHCQDRRLLRFPRRGGRKPDFPPLKRRSAAHAKGSTRERLIGATEQLIYEGGLSAVTTQSVARTCGFSEGTIYRHFASREELIVTTLRERLPGEFQPHLDALARAAGQGDIGENVRAFVASILPIYTTLAPCVGMLAADPALAARNAEALHADGKTPRWMLSQVADYFREEQRLGRVAPDIDIRAAAGLMVGFCFYRSLMEHLFREDPIGLGDAEFSAAVSLILSRGVETPARTTSRKTLKA